MTESLLIGLFWGIFCFLIIYIPVYFLVLRKQIKGEKK